MILMMTTGIGVAYGDEPSVEGMIERAAEADDAPDASTALPEPTTRAVNVDVQWRMWKRSLSDGDPGFSQLETLQADAQSLGRPSLPYHQLALLYELQRGDEHGLEADDIGDLRDSAHELAPHLPYAKLEAARHHLELDPGSLYRAIPPYIEGVIHGYQWFDTRIGWALKFALLVLMATGIGFLGFILGQLLRYFGIAAYDGTRILPRGFSSTQTVILLVAVVLVPGLLLQSPMLSMLLLLLLVIPFQQLNERMVSVFFLALLAALPFVDDRLEELVIYPGSDAQELLHAHYHGCDEPCRQWLTSTVDDEAGVASYIERSDRFRSGQHDALDELATWFDEHDPATQNAELAGHWLNLEGAVLIARGDSDEAIEILERAADADTTNPAPWFNIGRAYQLLDEEAASHQAIENAFNRDLEGVSRQANFSRRGPHSFLMIQPLEGSQIWRQHRPGTDDVPSLIEPVWAVVAGDQIDFGATTWLGLAGILLVLLTLPLYLKRRVSSPCPKCGLARDPTETDETGDHHYCTPCYQTFVSGASLDYHARVHSEATLGRRDRLQQFLRRALSMTPGVGHIVAGHAIRGILALVIVLVGVLILIYPLGPTGAWRGAFALFREHWAGQAAIAWMLISIGASVGLTGMLRGIRPTRRKAAPPDQKEQR